MRYKAIFKDGIIITDNYEDEEMRTLMDNLQEDFRQIGIDYPVDVYNEDAKKVMTVVPVQVASEIAGSATDTLQGVARIPHTPRRIMQSLYQWLQERKGYTWAEAEETIDRYHNGMELPKEVLSDIKEYTEEFIQKFGH